MVHSSLFPVMPSRTMAAKIQIYKCTEIEIVNYRLKCSTGLVTGIVMKWGTGQGCTE